MKSVPEGFVEFPVPDRFVQLSGPLLVKPEPDGMRAGLMLDERHGNPMGIAHGGLLVPPSQAAHLTIEFAER